MEQALRHLSSPIKEAFEYRFFSNEGLLSHVNIASKLGVARSSVSNYLDKGFRVLKSNHLRVDGKTKEQWRSILAAKDPATYEDELPTLKKACGNEKQFFEFLSNWMGWPDGHFGKAKDPAHEDVLELLKTLSASYAFPDTTSIGVTSDWLVKHGRLSQGQAKQWARYAVQSKLLPLGRQSQFPLEVFITQALLVSGKPMTKDELWEMIDFMGCPYEGQRDRLPRITEQCSFVWLSTNKIVHKKLAQPDWDVCKKTSGAVIDKVNSSPDEVFLLRELWADTCPSVDYGVFRTYWRINAPAHWNVHWRSLADRVSVDGSPSVVGWAYFAEKATVNGRVDLRTWSNRLGICYRHVQAELNKNDKWSKDQLFVYKMTA
jgi:hypothetical protein